jgi:general secretion pathway protein I
MVVGRLRMMAGESAHLVMGAAGISLHHSRAVFSIGPRRLRKCRRLVSHARRQQAGFTLVEVIVALAMLSIGLTVLLGLISSSLRQAADAERMAEAGSLAQSLMAEIGVDLPISLQERDGHFANGYRWHLKMSPYGNAQEQEEWPIGVYTISAEVEWRDSERRRSYALTTLRLGPRQVRQ